MPADLRRAKILERIQRDGGASIGELARDYGVSPITVHRDLERLASDGLIERIHGGARPTGDEPDSHPGADRLDKAASAGAGTKEGDRRGGRPLRRGRRDDLRRLFDDLPGVRAPPEPAPAACVDARHELARNRYGAPRPCDSCGRDARRGRPNAEDDRRSLGGGVSGGPEHGGGVHLGRRGHLGARPDDDTAGALGHAPRRIGLFGKGNRPDRLLEVRPLRAALHRPARGARRGRRRRRPLARARRRVSRPPASTSSSPGATATLLPSPNHKEDRWHDP